LLLSALVAGFLVPPLDLPHPPLLSSLTPPSGLFGCRMHQRPVLTGSHLGDLIGQDALPPIFVLATEPPFSPPEAGSEAVTVLGGRPRLGGGTRNLHSSSLISTKSSTRSANWE